mmetsp:Transcript_7227/g.22204  ORF Transcript_7227/g.22204 Transcript_7227/m.22204 type:complete len:96 (-) Transcript_7227:106-393(-)|eukprot:CAMPEP_0113671338 /NCGR_PEP_ID=MMETSP0038_2-20120614/5650_1 /TAXON_ID=2898 /ORGANISM="Cryptomonas paramecium" /LENGTH=95 /DNA_ID=CAMNT_0000587481 /DNA_START=16 /DNA_END=303 /DNA_ORIENTATION=- /assembly_acc=CAM_ASM_000170
MANVLEETWEEIKTQSPPAMDSTNMGILILLLNIFLPGIGSIVTGVSKSKTSTIIVGVLQLLTSWIIVGWIWSIWWGILIYQKSSESWTAVPSPA